MRSLTIGTRESELAVWQANFVKNLLKKDSVDSELSYITSDGDVDLVTPLYDMGVLGIFTKTLDIALLNKRVDIAVHSMKDVPTQLPSGIRQAAVLTRGSYKDLLVFKKDSASFSREFAFCEPSSFTGDSIAPAFTLATSSIRRKAQWLRLYPGHLIENLRGNVNTRLKKLDTHPWHAAIFAAAGLERIHLRPRNAVELDWMLPAPAQGAIMVVCREDDQETFEICSHFNDAGTALCTKIERDFLKTLMGGCSTPISALAEIIHDKVIFKGNICSPDGTLNASLQKDALVGESHNLGIMAAHELLHDPAAQQVIAELQHAAK